MGNRNTWQYAKHLPTLISHTLPSKSKNLVFRSNYAFFFDLCSNPIYYSKILKYNLAKNKTIFKAKQTLESKANDLDKMERVLQIGFEVASSLMKKFWRLESNFQKEIEDFYEKNFRNYFVIGIQMRVQFLDENKDIHRFIKCANQIEERLSNGTKVKWFISSDKSWIFKQFSVNYKEKIIQGLGNIGHTSHNLNSYYRTIFDNEMLARANEIIITGGSTFGFVAAFRTAKLPFYVEGKRSKYVNSSADMCTRMKLSRLPRSPSGLALF